MAAEKILTGRWFKLILRAVPKRQIADETLKLDHRTIRGTLSCQRLVPIAGGTGAGCQHQ
jgi:hypothetical protein